MGTGLRPSVPSIHLPIRPLMSVGPSEVPSGSIPSGALSLTQEVISLGGVDFTTTAVNEWTMVTAKYVDVAVGNQAIFAGGSINWKWNPDSGTPGITLYWRLRLYDGDASGSSYSLIKAEYVPGFYNTWETTTALSMFSTRYSLSAVIPGRRTMSLEVYAATAGAGTLSVYGSNDYTVATIFVCGDTSD